MLSCVLGALVTLISLLIGAIMALVTPKENVTGGAPPRKCAYVFLVMLGDAYTHGALVTAGSLRARGTKHDIVFMVTPDVSEKARAAMRILGHVREVPLLEFPCRPLATEKQRTKLYPWASKSFTKWNALALTDYDKVLVCDADMVFLPPADGKPTTEAGLPVDTTGDPDELFNLNAPAACFANAWGKPTLRTGLPNPYFAAHRKKHSDARELPHGARVSADTAVRALAQPTFTALTALTLLRPSAADYEGLLDMVRAQVAKHGQYGFHHRLRASTPEEAAIVEYFARVRRVPWTHIHQRFEAIPRKKWGVRGAVAFHYLASHPWEISEDEWPDLRAWWRAARGIAADHPDLAEWLQPPEK